MPVGGFRRGLGRTAARSAVVAPLCAVALAGAATAALAFGVVVVVHPTVDVSPTGGIPGASIDAVATYFGAGAATPCEVFWDDTTVPVPCAVDDNGAATVRFTVPPSASPTAHRLVVAVTARKQVAGTYFVVDPWVAVPGVTGEPVAAAATSLHAAGLVLAGSGTDPARVVAAQTPAAGLAVTPGSVVTVALSPTPTPTTTPPPPTRPPTTRPPTTPPPTTASASTTPPPTTSSTSAPPVPPPGPPQQGAGGSGGGWIGRALLGAAAALLAAAAAALAHRLLRPRPRPTSAIRLVPRPDRAARHRTRAERTLGLPSIRLRPRPDSSLDFVIREAPS